MKKLNLFIACQLLCMLMPFFSFAQTNQTEEFISSMSFDEFVANLKKNIVIDKEDYNISIDYIDSQSKELIISGVAKNLGGLKSETFEIVSSKLSFQVEIKQSADNVWILNKNKMIYSFKASYGDFHYLSTEILETIEDEMEIMIVNRNEFEIDDYFYNKQNSLISELEKYKSLSEDVSLKKKERKSAMYQYENMKTKCDFYQTLGRNSESLITRLKLYYFH